MREISEKAARWPLRPLGELLVRHNEIIHPGDRTDGSATFVGLEHIEPHTGRRIGASTVDLANLTGRKPTFRHGQIVYGYLRPYLNKVWIAEFDGCSSVDQFAFDVRRELVDVEYVAAFMRSDTFLRRAAMDTTTGQLPRISAEAIAAVRLEVPPLPVQREVAAKLAMGLSAAEKARTAAEQRLAAVTQLPAAYASEVFDTRRSEAWNICPLGQLVEGQGQYGTSQRANGNGDGVPVLGMRNIHEGRIRWQGVATVNLPAAEVEKYKLATGDILFNRTNSAELVGKTAVFDGMRDAVFASYLIRYRVAKDRADPDFLCAYINSAQGREYIERHMARAIGQVNISASTMHRMPIPCPPVTEQRRLASELAQRSKAADNIISACREEVRAIQAIPNALLREVFNGVC